MTVEHDRMEALERRPLADLFVPGLVASTLGRLGVETVADVLRLNLDNARLLHGVGKRKLAVLAGVRELAHNRFLHDVQPTEDTPLLDLCPEAVVAHVVADARVWTVAELYELAARQTDRYSGRGRDICQLARFMSQWVNKGPVPAKPGRRHSFHSFVMWTRRLESAGIDTSLPWSAVVQRVPARIRAALDSAGIDTLAGMADAIDGKVLFAGESGDMVPLWKLPNIGIKSLRQIESELARFAKVGLDAYLFRGRRPATIRELVEVMRASLEPRRWTSLKLRAGGAPYQRIAAEFGVSRERGRQLVSDAQTRLAVHFGALAGELLHELTAAFANRLLLATPRALELAGADSVVQLNIALLVLGRPLAGEVGAFLSLRPGRELEHQLGRLRVHLRAQIKKARWHGISLDELDTLGLAMGRDELALVLGDDIVEVGGGRVRLSRLRYTQADELDDILRDAGEPLHMREIAARSRHDWRDRPWLGHQLIVMESAVQWGRKQYIHRSHLPLSEAEIGRLRRWAAEVLAKERGAVEAGELFARFARSELGRDDINEFVLCSLAAEHPEVKPLGRTRLVHVDHIDGHAASTGARRPARADS